MSYKTLLYEEKGRAAHIILNRPEKLNALTVEMGDEIVDAFKRAGDDDNIKLVVLKGAGKCFTTGHDLNELGLIYGWGVPKPGEKAPRPSIRRRLVVDREKLLRPHRAVFESFKPVVAQVHGYCLEEGLYMSLMTDIVIAADDTIFGFPGQRLSAAGTMLVTHSLFVHVGPKKARELLLLGERFGAEEAKTLGIINRVAPRANLDEAVDKVVQSILQVPADGLVLGKEYTRQVYASLGVTDQFTQAGPGHTLMTNLRYDPDESNFLKERRDKGAIAAVSKVQGEMKEGKK
ncbi:MAG: enoyl-CoA hydratase/isomerase family protein [Chloroflexi bacterium]|nr:enoyl-CoA hydratase/isomerase family protein [Chloroflexota bacterium]MBI4415739.1 enoyl-CoA hydratase/isomerase family protein [Euryarchaeota archaeon]